MEICKGPCWRRTGQSQCCNSKQQQQQVCLNVTSSLCNYTCTDRYRSEEQIGNIPRIPLILLLLLLSILLRLLILPISLLILRALLPLLLIFSLQSFLLLFLFVTSTSLLFLLLLPLLRQLLASILLLRFQQATFPRPPMASAGCAKRKQFAHGDDFFSTSGRKDLLWLKNVLSHKLDLKSNIEGHEHTDESCYHSSCKWS